jgi:cell wall-associated NlpC family hydrolase
MQTRGVVIAGVANLYSEPSTAVELVSQAIVGTEVSVEEEMAGWYQVRTPDQYQGWIEASNVRRYAPDEAGYASAGPIVEVQSLLAFVYREPRASIRAPTLVAPIGARLELAGEQGTWLRVTLPDRAACWVQKGDVKMEEAGTSRPRGRPEDVIAVAKRLLGLPYLWGGTTPLGIDCSGLVQLAYHLNGVELLRDADLQFAQPGLAAVDRDDLQTGDLLFFGQSRVTHVGMYIEDGRFIQATVHERPVVQISHLEEPHWTELYRGARRP